MFKRYLICTDLIDGLQGLVNFVPDLTQAGCEQLVFTHTVPLWDEGDIPRIDEAKVEHAKEVLEQALRPSDSAVEVVVDVQSGRPQETIPKLVKTYGSDVVFTGTATRNLLQETLFGSTSLSVARSTAVPLMLLRPQLISTYTQEELALRCQHLWRYLLVPYSGSDSAKYLVQQLKAVIQADTARSLQQLRLLQVVSKSTRKGLSPDYQRQVALETLEAAKKELATCDVEVTTEVRMGDPMQEILQAAQVHDISAIATAHVSRNALAELTAPSFANEILRHSWFPVLFFSPKR